MRSDEELCSQPEILASNLALENEVRFSSDPFLLIRLTLQTASYAGCLDLPEVVIHSHKILSHLISIGSGNLSAPFISPLLGKSLARVLNSETPFSRSLAVVASFLAAGIAAGQNHPAAACITTWASLWNGSRKFSSEITRNFMKSVSIAMSTLESDVLFGPTVSDLVDCYYRKLTKSGLLTRLDGGKETDCSRIKTATLNLLLPCGLAWACSPTPLIAASILALAVAHEVLGGNEILEIPTPARNGTSASRILRSVDPQAANGIFRILEKFGVFEIKIPSDFIFTRETFQVALRVIGAIASAPADSPPVLPEITRNFFQSH